MGVETDEDHPVVLCLAGAIERTDTRDSVADVGTIEWAFESGTVPASVAELVVDCMLDNGWAEELIAGVESAEGTGVTLPDDAQDCIRTLADDPDTRDLMVEALLTGLGRLMAPGPLLDGLLSCINPEDRPQPQGRIAPVRDTQGNVDADLVQAYFLEGGVELSTDEIACVLAAIEDGTIEELELGLQALVVEPSCVSTETFAASLVQNGFPSVTNESAECVRSALRVGVANPNELQELCFS